MQPEDDQFSQQQRNFQPNRPKQIGLWLIGGVGALAAIIYFMLNFVPEIGVHLLSSNWTERKGKAMEAELVHGARSCHTPKGDAALATILARLAEADSDLPPLAVQVFDMKVMNAWALPAGHIVVTRGLIEKSDDPTEVAGVIAHELGHVTHHHPEAQLIRALGLTILVGSVSGTSSSSNGTSASGLPALMNSSRAAESQADAYAVQTLIAAKLDPVGLKTFLERVLKEEGIFGGGILSKIGSLYSSHPGTEERMKLIAPLPADVEVKPLLTDVQWYDLKHICV